MWEADRVKSATRILNWFLVPITAIGLSGCLDQFTEMRPGIIGLIPIYPEVRVRGMGGQLYFVQADSLNPEFRWEAFPATGEFAGRITDVTYELQILEIAEGLPGTVLYKRNGLLMPFHKLERSLEPSKEYLWTIRARFLLDGHPRVTAWGMSRQPLVPEDLRRRPGGYSPNFYHFKTPAV